MSTVSSTRMARVERIAGTTPVQTVNAGGVAARSYARLRQAIVENTFQPGQRLVESDLIEFLGASRTTVRSVLVRLDQEGLIELESHHGARVRLVSNAEAVELEQARMALESLMAGEAARQITDVELRELRGLLSTMRVAVERTDPLLYAELDMSFHRKIWTIARHRVGANLLGNLKSQSIRFQFRTILQPGRPQQSLREHKAIVDALQERDARAAEAAMRRHLENVIKTLEAAIERHQIRAGAQSGVLVADGDGRHIPVRATQRSRQKT